MSRQPALLLAPERTVWGAAGMLQEPAAISVLVALT